MLFSWRKFFCALRISQPWQKKQWQIILWHTFFGSFHGWSDWRKLLGAFELKMLTLLILITRNCAVFAEETTRKKEVWLYFTSKSWFLSFQMQLKCYLLREIFLTSLFKEVKFLLSSNSQSLYPITIVISLLALTDTCIHLVYLTLLSVSLHWNMAELFHFLEHSSSSVNVF